MGGSRRARSCQRIGTPEKRAIELWPELTHRGQFLSENIRQPGQVGACSHLDGVETTYQIGEFHR